MPDDVLSEFDPLIAAAEHADYVADQGHSPATPWVRKSSAQALYQPNMTLLTDILAGPIRSGASTQSGRLAKGLDAWISYELRRAKFHPAEVWPRNKSPRVSSPGLDSLAEKVDALTAWVAERDQQADQAAQKAEADGDETAVSAARERLQREHTRLEKRHQRRLATLDKRHQTTAAGADTMLPPATPTLPTRVSVTDPLLPGLRGAIRAVEKAMPTTNATDVLGRFYVKQVDVMVSSWDRGPDVLISGKTMFSSFANNAKNRYEETLGEASNLRDRYPLAAMGYAFLVSNEIFNDSGAYARLQDLLLRTRKPFGPYDATMLLIATWSPQTHSLTLHDPSTHPDPTVAGQQPPVDLSAERFFTDLLGTVIANTPVGVHEPVRELRNGAPAPGGTPTSEPVASDTLADAPSPSPAVEPEPLSGGHASPLNTQQDGE